MMESVVDARRALVASGIATVLAVAGCTKREEPPLSASTTVASTSASPAASAAARLAERGERAANATPPSDEEILRMLQGRPSTGSAAAPATGAPSSGSTPPAAHAALPFVASREEACSQYKSASNDIKKSKIFSDYKAATENAAFKVTDISGTIKTLETSRGGATVSLYVTTDVGTFTSNDIMVGHKRTIKKGSAVYNALGDLNVGDKIVFSATMVAPDFGITEEVSVCGTSWVAMFTAVRKQ